MKITIDRLKEIIKEEISEAESSLDPNVDDKLSKYTSGATQKVRNVLGRQNIIKALGSIADELAKYQEDVAMQSKIVGEMMSIIGINPDGLYRVAMHLRTKTGKNNEL